MNLSVLRTSLLASLLLTACALDPDPADDLAETGQELSSLKVVITSAPASTTNQATATFTYRASTSGASFYCRVDGAPYAPCSPAGITYHVTDGAHTFFVYARRGGQTSAAATWSWTVDTTPPTVTITSMPPAVSNAATATFTFVASDPGATLQCQLDGGPFVACMSPFTVTSLANGAHTFSVRAVDSAGNVSAAASVTWTVDTTAPALVITSAPPNPSSSTSATFTFATSEPAGTACSLDGNAFFACVSPVSYVGLTLGAHQLVIRATDSAGNVSSVSYVWTIL